MAAAMEQSSCSSRRYDEPEFSLREWRVKARISRENTASRRYSGSYIRSFREDSRSFRSNITIYSTASSPGYSLKDEIDPSTYSFTTALKALQARNVYNTWECLSPEGFALNSKWNEAEKYICNPLSGEVPMECLSAKTLSGRSFRNFSNRITMSAPLVYSHSPCHIATKTPRTVPQDKLQVPEKKAGSSTRDVGTQSTPPGLSSDSLSLVSTPSITERALKRCGTETGDSTDSNTKLKADEKVEVEKTRENEETKEQQQEETKQIAGCLSWMRKRQRKKHKSKRKSNFCFA
ncbi:hypothetical protein V6N13_137617 [Hibiscus sabdariffa]|uniref:Uncharacterized protein n=1 Tax=Hibiscus sabdariffa TaxID=183260 RepID=A0ABR2DLP4_9ROSI